MIRVALLTVSDGVAAGAREDTSGSSARAWVEGRGWTLVKQLVVPDEAERVVAHLEDWTAGGGVDLVLTLGGTGLGPRDVTPEATLEVLDRLAPGIPEALRAAGSRATRFAYLSRGVAGTRGRTLIVNLPGSRKAVEEGLEVLAELVPHAVDLLQGRTEHRARSGEGPDGPARGRG